MVRHECMQYFVSMQFIKKYSNQMQNYRRTPVDNQVPAGLSIDHRDPWKNG